MKHIENKIKLITEEIQNVEKQENETLFLNEMKKIGIEKLPYSYSALKQFIDAETMNYHYNKHYKGYVDKLNKALSDKKGDMELEEIVKSISKFDNSVRNNAGGAFNHALFWKMLSPKTQTPNGDVIKQIKKDFKTYYKQNMEPFESLFLRLGAVVLQNAQNFLAANPSKTVQEIRTELAQLIRELQANPNPAILSKLQLELKRIERLGGFDAIVPAEGIVFTYQGNTYKMTGAFAPVNQILGVLKYAR